ncbi:hypothetical protein ADIARSV_0049 [Arcticibacter svalbardensis MN12-7]|uniref:Uncharacterized protein n=1 Tax=Arcticibacter svalbardensis MN12-7 TaxID=1150600 RepID=R9GYF6_9SPHI|nr:hypothetical protein ADIARSV_0049 [Arcticibacter svalbardensis MN12-7]
MYWFLYAVCADRLVSNLAGSLNSFLPNKEKTYLLNELIEVIHFSD